MGVSHSFLGLGGSCDQFMCTEYKGSGWLLPAVESIRECTCGVLSWYSDIVNYNITLCYI